MKRNLKISSKLMLTFLAVALVPMLVSGIVFYQHLKSSLTHEIFSHLFSVASIQKHRLQSSHEQNLERLSLIASRTQMRLSLQRYLDNSVIEELQKIKKIIQDAKSSIHGIVSVSVLSVKGLVLISTDKNKIGTNSSHNDYFIKALKINNADSLSLSDSGSLKLITSGPLILNKTVIGVIVIESAADTLLSMTSDYSGLGRTGETMLVKTLADGNKINLTPVRFNIETTKRILPQIKRLPLSFIDETNNPISELTLDYRSKQVLSVTKQLGIANWSLIVKIDRDEALEPIDNLLAKVPYALFIISSLVFVTAFFISRSISRPIETLTQMATDIGNGQRNIILGSILNQAPEEIHSLGMSIDDMSRSLLTSELASQYAHEQLRKMAYYDPLTGMANRSFLLELMNDCLARAKRSDTLVVVCLLDLDGFKPVNDKYGHEIGDKLLLKVSQQLKKQISAEDKIARLGGDEFAFLLVNFQHSDQCIETLDMILETLSHSYQVNNHLIKISGSIGVTIYPNDNGDPDSLLRHADQAMYSAKENGRNCYQFFDHDAEQRISSKLKYLKEIEKAIKNEEMVLYFQPKVDMLKGKIIGVEALVRWNHPEQGLLLPLEFLPHIENSSLQQKLDWWVVDSAIKQIEQWWTDGLNFSVSINLTPKTILQPGFVSKIGSILDAQSHINGHAIEFEILESSSLENIDGVANVIKQCALLGIKFSLDDFGTGYSSLTYVRRLPAQVLKIDQSFVRDMLDDTDDLYIVEGVVGLARAFKRELIAEGVETERHGLMLIELGCHSGQGYFIAKPMPAEKIINWDKQYIYPKSWLNFDKNKD
jgi:diguanylate cyclase (GGDEF)-like protein